MSTKVGASFARPVVEMYPTLREKYLEVILKPMDLETVRVKVKDMKSYGDDPMLLFADLKLIYENCMRFNSDPVLGIESRLLAEAYWGKACEEFDKKFKHLRFGRPLPEPEPAPKPAVVRLRSPARPAARVEAIDSSSSEEEDVEPRERRPRARRSRRPTKSDEQKEKDSTRKLFLKLAKGWIKWPDIAKKKQLQLDDLASKLEVIVKVGRSSLCTRGALLLLLLLRACKTAHACFLRSSR